MTTTTTKIGTAASKVADTLTGARTDTSGLMSAVIAYMGDANSPGHREVHERARHAGLESRLDQWENHTSSASADEETVKKLFPTPVIERFANETGHTPNATIKALADLMPHLSRLDS